VGQRNGEGFSLKRAMTIGYLKVNAAPDLDHYAGIGAQKKRVVDCLYLNVLEAMKDLP
jgi:hypothetical protein